ncbi:succinylglutamate desuccinylase/aspartoacylase family protein [Cerasicoccus arenae]|uniref:Succinate dehydrogenase n=1 Tax=Cerasicoccus arenae TaxID=424488 RepID=A0A8J3GDS8_9BACT|nr:succinylglutamate desuccinylase/aspartoacylase family protein [Cerasicoccus arenae]MBK1859140.1 succinylglutamate desuccinylase/aspartoacylase family protein [Cerasicoccus arenae]GHB98080.1 succinate dehydrogenase [Cerasicoccus arenae]
MTTPRKRSRKVKPIRLGDETIQPGEAKDVRLKISETYTGDEIALPVRVIHSAKPGPKVFISAAIHGDEINGTGIVHDLLYDVPMAIECGTLFLIPVVNVFGFETHERYLPDRRDLNRSFPGNESGSLASRVAAIFMREIVSQCDYGLDLHSAAFQRTNFPNVRADLSNPDTRKLALAFGCSLIVDGRGPEGSLRREACKIGCPTIILEAGEPWKIERGILELGVRGIRNTLIKLGMLSGEPITPAYQIRVKKTTWVRAEVGGILRYHIGAGDWVEAGQPIATNYTILGHAQHTLVSPADGIILSLATLPAVKPGEPIVHIAIPTRSIPGMRKSNQQNQGLAGRVRRDLATNIAKVEIPAETQPD